MAYVYRILNLVNGKSYVGQTVRTPDVRLQEHLRLANGRSQAFIHKAIRKHGLESMRFEVLEECDVSILDERERHWIESLKCLAPDGYNLTEGGSTGAASLTLREENRRRCASYEWRKKVSEGTLRGKSAMTQEAKDLRRMRISNALKGRKQPWAKANVLLTRTPESRRKMSETRKGVSRKWTEASLDSWRSKMTGQNHPRSCLTPAEVESLLESFNPSARPKMKEYKRLASEFGISEVSVRRILKGRHWSSKPTGREEVASS